MQLIDSHCHLDLSAFDNDRLEVLEQSAQAGIQRILLPGLSNQQFHKLRELRKQYSGHEVRLDIALGLHPYFLKAANDQGQQAMLQKFTDLAHAYHAEVVGFGEMGLDGTLPYPMDFQEEVLRVQIELASYFNKPLIMHHRQSHNELIRLLKQVRFSQGGVIHAFSGSYQIARTYIDMGFALGVGGTISYERANKTISALEKIELEHMLLETDSPDMPLNGFQGMRNSPSQLPLVAAHLSELKQVSFEEIASITSENYSRLFSLS